MDIASIEHVAHALVAIGVLCIADIAGQGQTQSSVENWKARRLVPRIGIS